MKAVSASRQHLRRHRETAVLRDEARRSTAVHRPRWIFSAAVLVSALGAGLLVPAATTPAQARGKVFTKPTALTVAASSSGSFTAVAKVKGAKKYRIYAATTKREVNASHFKKAPWHSRWSRSKAVTISGLPYRTEPYYYRYAAKGPGRVKFSTIQAAYLTPPTPTGMSAFDAPGGGLALRWSAASAERYVVSATAPGRSDVLKSWTVRGNARAFTPYGLTPGRYDFRVRAINGPSGSGWSVPVTAKVPSTAVPLRVMTYNLLWTGADGDRRTGGETVGRWLNDRRDAAAALVRSADPDVLVVQEANVAVDKYGLTQADSLRRALGGGWILADNGDTTGANDTFVLYRSSVLSAVSGANGSIVLPADHNGKPWHATYQLLQYPGNGPRVLVVSAHFAAGDKSDDRNRQRQAEVLTTQVEALAKRWDASVVYGGDFNSHPGKKHPLDGPGVTFAAHRTPDAYDVAQTVVNGRFNSANQYLRTPPKSFDHIDHLFAGPGVAVTRWQLVLRLNGAQFAGTIPSDHNPLVADLLLPS